VAPLVRVLRRIRTRQTSSVLVAVLALAVSFRLEYLIFPASTPIALLLQELPRLSTSCRFLIDLFGVVSSMVSRSRRLLIKFLFFQPLPVFAPCSFASRSLNPLLFANRRAALERIDSLPVSTMWQ